MHFSGPYSQAVSANGVLFTAGQIGMVPGTLDLIPGGAANEATLSMRSLKRVLKVYRRDILDARMAVCYTTSSSYRDVVVDVWRKEVGGDRDMPLAVPVVPGLPKGAKVEWHLILNAVSEDKLESFYVSSCVIFG